MNTSNVRHFVLVFLFRITDIMFLHPPIILHLNPISSSLVAFPSATYVASFHRSNRQFADPKLPRGTCS